MHHPGRVSIPRQVLSGTKENIHNPLHTLRLALLAEDACTTIMESQMESIDISSIKAAALQPVEVWMHPGLRKWPPAASLTLIAPYLVASG